MYQRRRTRILLSVMVLSALVLVTVDFRSGDEGPLWRLRGIATSVFAPIQDGIAVILSPVGDAVDSVTELVGLRDENERLEARVSQLEQRRRSMEDLERENAELRELLGMQRRTELDVIPARTIALGPSNYEWTVTLNVGANDGVARNMVVINGDGLVGRVVQVTPNASRVLLAIDHNFSAASRAARIGETGPVDGRGGDLMVFRPLNPEAPVKPGDELVTAAYENGLFPPGIPIGEVEEVGDETSLLAREVLVRPYVDFTRLGHVLVVRNAPPETPPPLDQEPDGDYEPPTFEPDRPRRPGPSPTGEPV